MYLHTYIYKHIYIYIYMLIIYTHTHTAASSCWGSDPDDPQLRGARTCRWSPVLIVIMMNDTNDTYDNTAN